MDVVAREEMRGGPELLQFFSTNVDKVGLKTKGRLCRGSGAKCVEKTVILALKPSIQATGPASRLNKAGVSFIHDERVLSRSFLEDCKRRQRAADNNCTREVGAYRAISFNQSHF